MRTTAVLLAITFARLLPAAAAEPAQRAQIAQELQHYAEAWNQRDATAAASFFTSDATLLSATGKLNSGPSEIRKAIEGDLEMLGKGSRHELKLLSARELRDDLVFVDAEQVIRDARLYGRKVPELRVHVAALMLNKEGRWKWLDARAYTFGPSSAAPAPERAGIEDGLPR
jgi:uncharacterized protein (TIGR02246 family)